MMSQYLLVVILLSCVLCASTTPAEEFCGSNNELNERFSELNFISNKHFKRSVKYDLTPDDYFGSKFNKSVSICNDPISYVCSNDFPKPFENNLSKLKNILQIKTFLEELLNQKPNDNELKSLSIEKKLYQKCMNLKHISNPAQLFVTPYEVEYLDLFTIVFEMITQNKTWQYIDNKLSDIGFGHFFYDVKLVHHPEKLNHRIIELQPPVLDIYNIAGIGDLLYPLFETTEQSQAEDVIKETKPLNTSQNILRFIESFVRITYDVNTEDDAQLNNPMTLREWNKMYHSYGRNQYQRENTLDWSHILREDFKRVNITIDENELILVKQTKYFQALANLLTATPNEVIAASILSNKVSHHLKRIEAIKVISDSNLKTARCFEILKFYAAPYLALRSFEKEDAYYAALNECIQRIVKNIVNVLITEVDNSESLQLVHKAYIRSELKAVTLNLLGKVNEDYISNYYGDFEVNNSFLLSSLKFQRIQKDKELSSLREVSELPVDYLISISKMLDFYRAHTLIITAMFMIRDRLKSLKVPLSQGVLYSTYGVYLSSSVHEILVRAILNDNTMVEYLEHLHTPPKVDKYSPVVKRCFDEENLMDMDRYATFGLNIAHKAFVNDLIESNKSLLPEAITALHQLFYLSYIKDNCFMDNDTMKKNLLNSPAFIDAFKCTHSESMNNTSQCILTAFPMIN